MELHAHKPGVNALRQFDNFGELLGLRQCRNHQASLAQALQVGHIGLVAVAVALGDGIAVNAVRQSAGLHIRRLCAQAHGSAHIGLLAALLQLAVCILPFGNQGDDGVGGVWLKLGGVGLRQPQHIARIFDGGYLHP